MAKVGEQLLAPEVGWQRIESENANISYTGSWINNSDGGTSGGYYMNSTGSEDKLSFNFIGTKLRMIGASNTISYRPENMQIYIDGSLVGTYNQIGSILYRRLDFEKVDLVNKEHTVVVTVNGSTPVKGYCFDSIDIDSDGEIKSYTGTPSVPTPTSNSLLRVTMNDSSEREYRLSTTDINKFIQWINQTINAGNNCYTFNDTIDGSTEYLSFEKIISFKVLPLVN